MRANGGVSDPAKQQNDEKDDTEPVNRMSQEHHQPLHLRYDISISMKPMPNGHNFAI
jgi:hypothetical protein